jgi:hypothetical protein
MSAPYRLSARVWPDRGAVQAAGIVITREGETRTFERGFALQAPHAHGGTLLAIEKALMYLDAKGKPGGVVVVTNMTSVRGVCAGTAAATSYAENVHRIRDLLRARNGTVVCSFNRDGDAHMERAFALAQAAGEQPRAARPTVPVTPSGHLCSLAAHKLCNVALAIHLLMCAPHWRMVPKPLQQKVYRAWEAYQRGDIDLNDLRVVQAAATAAVVAKIGGGP